MKCALGRFDCIFSSSGRLPAWLQQLNQQRQKDQCGMEQMPTSAPQDFGGMSRRQRDLLSRNSNGGHPASHEMLRPLQQSDALSPTTSSLVPASPESYLSDPAFEDLSVYTTPSFENDMDDPIASLLQLSDDNHGLVRDHSEFPEADQVHHKDGSIGSTGTTVDSRSRLLSPVLTNASTPSSRGVSSQLQSGQKANASAASNTRPGQTLEIDDLKRTPSHLSNTSAPAMSINAYSEYFAANPGAPSGLGQQDSVDASTTNAMGGPIARTPTIQTHHVDDEEDESRDSALGAEQNGRGRLGLSPEQRDNVDIPSLEDQDKARHLDAKNADVEQWLDESDAGSGAESPEGPKARKQVRRRLRAYSANAASRYNTPESRAKNGLDDSGIPGPGVFVDEVEDDDDDDDDEDEEDVDEDEVEHGYMPSNQYDSEPTANPYRYDPYINDGLPESGTTPQDDTRRPWTDSPLSHESVAVTGQPPSSNAAIWRFQQRVRETDTASIQATIGSRRRSETDLDSVFSAAGISVRVPTANENKEKQARPSLLNRVLSRGPSNNSRKRKDSDNTKTNSTPVPPSSQRGSQGSIPARVGSWARSKSPAKSPKVDTSAIPAPRVTSPSNSTLSPAHPWAAAKSVLRRSRSRSDIVSAQGIGDLWRQQGGPPVPALNPQPSEGGSRSQPKGRARKPPASLDSDDDDDDDDEEGLGRVSMPLKIQYNHIQPTQDGFMAQVRQLNPRLHPFMVERVTQEQLKRYRRLMESRLKHANTVQSGKCQSGNLCSILGNGPVYLPPRNASKNAEAPPVIFQVHPSAESPTDSNDPLEDNLTIAAGFPEGIPLPPVQRLPAEFECPLCFQKKKISKPSDWTKHVHEDLQPFTCTFPNCVDPKSFKRKADWVRHENERHRQLEKWICHFVDCQHVCFRKDNFVQHLVREHKLPEPNLRGSKSSAKSSALQADTGEVASLVESCRVNTPKTPGDEPCRFCGNMCTTWKKLTVHLAKHMEQISIPILHLISQSEGSLQPLMSPVDADHARLSSSHVGMPNTGFPESPEEFQGSQYTFNPPYDLAQHVSNTQPISISPSGFATAQTYPPPNYSRGNAPSPQPGYVYGQHPVFVSTNHMPDLSNLSVQNTTGDMNSGQAAFSSQESAGDYSAPFSGSPSEQYYGSNNFHHEADTQDIYGPGYGVGANQIHASSSSFAPAYPSSTHSNLQDSHAISIAPTSHPTSHPMSFVGGQQFSTSPSEGGSFSNSRVFNTSDFSQQYHQNAGLQPESYFQSSPASAYTQDQQQGTASQYMAQTGGDDGHHVHQQHLHSATYPPQVPYGSTDHAMLQGQFGNYYNQ